MNNYQMKSASCWVGMRRSSDLDNPLPSRQQHCRPGRVTPLFGGACAQSESGSNMGTRPAPPEAAHALLFANGLIEHGGQRAAGSCC
jgi:hypothetical protein